MPIPLLAAAAKAAAPMLKKAAAKAIKRKAVSTAQKAVSKKKEEENQAKRGMKVKKYNKGGKGDPKKAFSSKSEAAKAKLEAQIKKVKGTPAAKPLVKKYRSMFKAMKGAKVYANGGDVKGDDPLGAGDALDAAIPKASNAKAVIESADEAKVPAGGGKGKKGLKKAGEIIGKQRANYDKRRATGEGAAARSSMMSYKKGGKAKKFPDLTGDGKVTMADILKGRGVVAKNGVKVKKKKKYVAKGADKADVRGDRKAARINKRLKRKA